jgi:peptidoglycan/xylan/chitin deacetylase (PgdA/CDA1 family)
MAHSKPANGKQSLKRALKGTIKHSLQILAARFGRHARQPGQPELLLLMYHRILPANDPRAQTEEPGMMVTPETFRLHMSLIKPLFEVMHLSQWLALKNSGDKLPKRACIITFDDGWADNYEFAYPILKELGIPATIFLVSDMIGTNHHFWPERLGDLVTAISRQPEVWTDNCLNWITALPVSYRFDKNNAVAPTQEQLSEIIAATKSLSDDEIHHRLDSIIDTLKDTLKHPASSQQTALLSWQQVEIMCRTGLIEIGSHTCNHIRLTEEKSPDDLKHEIVDSKHNIEKRTGLKVKSFCYPNGDYSAAARQLVEQHYDGAVTTKNGWNNSDNNAYLLQRIGLHEDISNNRTRFLARISGWL